MVAELLQTIRLQKYHEEPHKFLLEEVASLDGRLDRRYQVPTRRGQRRDEAIVTQQSNGVADIIQSH